MGAVFRPKDLPSSWRKRVQESIKDSSSDTKSSILNMMDSCDGKKSEERKLKEPLCHDKAETLLKRQ
jgi:hypothetical protein